MTKDIKINAQGDRLIVAKRLKYFGGQEPLIVSTKNLFVSNVFISCICDTEQYICLYSVS